MFASVGTIFSHVQCRGVLSLSLIRFICNLTFPSQGNMRETVSTVWNGRLGISPSYWRIYSSFEFILERELSTGLIQNQCHMQIYCFKNIPSDKNNIFKNTWMQRTAAATTDLGLQRISPIKPLRARGSFILARVTGQFIVSLKLFSNGHNPLDWNSNPIFHANPLLQEDIESVMNYIFKNT